jgi:hypothetical protein
MPALAACIHALIYVKQKVVDGRIKSGHDG